MTATVQYPLCACGCGAQVTKPQNRYIQGHAYGSRSDKAPRNKKSAVQKRRDLVHADVLGRRSASAVEAIADLMLMDQKDITPGTLLADDLGMDELDLVELGKKLGIEDECVDWVYVGDVEKTVAKGQS